MVTSDTDTEVIVHQIYRHLDQGEDLVDAVRNTTRKLKGAYALGVAGVDQPGRLVAARNGPPLLVGVGDGQGFIASDVAALVSGTRHYFVLENGDVADVGRNGIKIYDVDGERVERPLRETKLSADAVSLGESQQSENENTARDSDEHEVGRARPIPSLENRGHQSRIRVR